MGNVRKTKNGKYSVDVINRYGKRVRTVFDKKSDAQKAITRIEADKYEAKLVNNGIKRARITLYEAIEKTLEDKKNLAKRSYIKYKNVFHQFDLFCAHQRIEYVDEFNKSHADLFDNQLKSSGASPKTINFYLMTVKAFFQDQLVADYIIKNPFEHIKYKKSAKKTLKDREEEYLTAEEIRKFFSISMEEKYQLAYIGLLLTGMRIGELGSIKWSNINWEDRVIEVRSTDEFKTKTITSERDIPISNFLLKKLETLNKNKKSEYVFSSLADGQMSERTLLSKCKRIAKETDIEKNVTLHMFRHSFSSHLAQNNVDYTVRQYLMGHKPQTMTDHYTKIDPKQLHCHVNLLDNLLLFLNDAAGNLLTKN